MTWSVSMLACGIAAAIDRIIVNGFI